jgi:HlyD family secretion protein
MSRRIVIPVSVLSILVLIFLGSGTFRANDRELGISEVTAGPFEVWAVYDGSLESRVQKDIMSFMGGSAAIMELAPEGAAVREGDVLVRFDSSQVERDILKLERDYAAAKAEYEGLSKAKLPLELRDLEVRLGDARVSSESERGYLEDCRQLREEALISEQEVKQQEIKVEAAKAQVENIEFQLDLTKKYLHPSALERAQAAMTSAEQELNIAKQQLQNCSVKAPADGMVVYRPVHVGGEYRTVRVGDTLYRNLPFMALPDMSRPVVQCNVPESELSLVRIGSEVRVVPVAYSDLKLAGHVESVGSMAQSVVGRPDWQRYFRVTIGISDSDARLRAGMSVRAYILSYSSSNSLAVPRTAVHWENEKAMCEVVRGGRRDRRELQLGMANEQYFEVLKGLEPGERIFSR